MLFCPKCGAILLPKTDGKKYKLVCGNCGYSSTEKEDILIQERAQAAQKVEIVDEKKIEKVLPKTEEECPKCGCKEAYFWTVQTRAGDEAETRFFECVKCKHRWRAYD